ncbi:hypothetical protein SBA5_410051 [Candidatus Sulfotelmatomonas gaucii]|uniref:Uncharacterized protein n=1 Tax=Candidatus Sulfuritelmatomonas gaucii TaxID=2043161 RepID=A0A2N9LL60_9BACT|nr:hypothetical protein SBA5_410051 [Candidatus Sulfotelmatomonas gaucii]
MLIGHAVCAVGQRMKLMPETVFGFTLRLALRIALVWAGGFVLAVVIRALLPDDLVLNFSGIRLDLHLPYSRIGFWTCLLAALTVSAMVVIRTMLLDLGQRPHR